MDAETDCEDEGALTRHASVHPKGSRAPLIAGGDVTLLASGAEAIDAVFAAIGAARHHLHLQYYEFQDVHWHGQSLIDLLVRKLRDGVRIALSYDGVGSGDLDSAVVDRLRGAGAAVFEFRPLSPLRHRFNLLTLNDRDHRKILVADGRVGILGGVNLTRVYENPPSAGTPPDPDRAFWVDCAARFEGPRWRSCNGCSSPTGATRAATASRSGAASRPCSRRATSSCAPTAARRGSTGSCTSNR